MGELTAIFRVAMAAKFALGYLRLDGAAREILRLAL